MKLKNIAANQTVLELNDGNEVFFSYQTPVAAFVSGEGYVATETQYSKTTSRHIGNYAGVKYKDLTKKPQSFFDGLVK
jgi:hypothetical protein